MDLVISISSQNIDGLISKLEDLGKKFDVFTSEINKLSNKIEKLAKITEEKMDLLKNSIINLSDILEKEDNRFISSIINKISGLSNKLNDFKQVMNIPIIKESANEIELMDKQTTKIDLTRQISHGLRDIKNIISEIHNHFKIE
ncbi:MAG: hypothetical protein ACTSPY_15175 [Candidatus Helarchaeota archaeon]